MAIFQIPQTEETSPVQPEKIVKVTQVLIEWTAPERIFVKKSREFYRKIAVIIIFFSLLLLIFKEIVFVAVLLAVYFVVYVATSIPPKNVTHQITTNGLNYASSHLYKWDYFSSFFMESKNGYDLLTLNTVDQLPGRMSLILEQGMDKNKVVTVVNEFVSIDEEPKSTMYEGFMSKVAAKIKI